MQETNENHRRDRHEELADARLGYQTVASLIGLVSQEVYSRFGAMLIVQGLLLTVVFGGEEGDDFVRVAATIAGLLLCPLWLFMVEHGIFYQHRFRGIARNLEQRYLKDVFTVFLSPEALDEDLTAFAPQEATKEVTGLARLRRISAVWDVERYAMIVVGVFFAVYAVMLWRIVSTAA